MPLPVRSLRPRASRFNPKTIANLAIWLDASNASSLTLNGNTVSEWRDLSGNNRHFSQATAATQPNANTTTQNGRRVIAYGGAQVLAGNTAALATTRNVGAITACAVAKVDVLSAPATGGNHVIFASSVGTALFARYFLTFETLSFDYVQVGGRRLDADNFASVFPANGTLNTNPYVIASVMDYANASASLRANGSALASGSILTAGNTSDTASQSVSVGATANQDGSVNSNQLTGWIAEVIVYRRALALTERTTIEKYLGAKWGITLA